VKYTGWIKNIRITGITVCSAKFSPGPHTQAGGTVVDPETAALLDYADTQYRVSGGLFDVTARSLSALWDRITSIPRQDEIDQALGKCGWEQVAWDGRTLEIPAGLTFDLGGIVKEYAADRVAGILRQAGIQSGSIDLGDDLHILGPHPDGTPWRAGIRNPDGSGNALATIGIRSGGFSQHTRHAGRRRKRIKSAG